MIPHTQTQTNNHLHLVYGLHLKPIYPSMSNNFKLCFNWNTNILSKFQEWDQVLVLCMWVCMSERKATRKQWWQHAAPIKTGLVIMKRFYTHSTPGGTDEGPRIWAGKKKTDGMTAGILRGSKKEEAVQIGKEGQKRQQLFRERGGPGRGPGHAKVKPHTLILLSGWLDCWVHIDLVFPWIQNQKSETALLAKCANTHKDFFSSLQVLPVLTLIATHNWVQHIRRKKSKV